MGHIWWNCSQHSNFRTMDEYVPLEEDAPEKEVPTPTLEQMKLPENVKPLGYAEDGRD